MNILIDIGHPAHVHLFHNLYFELQKKNHFLFLTVKNNLNAAKELLNYYFIPFISIGGKSDNLLCKAIKQINYDLKIAKIVKNKKIDLGIGTSINLAHASKITSMKSIILDDDDDVVQPLFTKFAHPFCDSLLSPEALKGNRKKKNTIFYSGFHELAYLHPNRFKPDQHVLKYAGLSKYDKFFILRFNSFKAHHDHGIHGLSLENKRKLIETLKRHGKIFISTERLIDPEFKKYQIKINPHKIHSFLYYATMFISDSQTMTSEAAILGTPAFKCNSFAGLLSVPNEIENKYGLCFSYLSEDFDKMLSRIEYYLHKDNLKDEWIMKKNKLLKDKIDVTAYLIWFVENYPRSMKEMYNNPYIQNQFK